MKTKFNIMCYLWSGKKATIQMIIFKFTTSKDIKYMFYYYRLMDI